MMEFTIEEINLMCIYDTGTRQGLMDALKAIEDEDVTLYLVNPKAPCFIRDEDETYTYLVLPVNFTR
jgi:hypothetical protein